MANITENTKKNTDLHQQMPAWNLKWSDKVSNTVLYERTKKTTSRKRNKEEKMEVDMTHTKETSNKHHTTITYMEPPKEEKKRNAEKHLTERHRKRNKKDGIRRERNGENYHKQIRASAPSEQTGQSK